MTVPNRDKKNRYGKRDPMKEHYEDAIGMLAAYITERDYWRRHLFQLKRSHERLERRYEHAFGYLSNAQRAEVEAIV